MILFRFGMFNLMALIVIIIAPFRIIEEFQLNQVYSAITILAAIFLFYKTYNYCPHWPGSTAFEDDIKTKKKKKKKKKGPIEDFFFMLSDTFDFLFGWAMPIIVFVIFLSIIVWVGRG